MNVYKQFPYPKILAPHFLTKLMFHLLRLETETTSPFFDWWVKATQDSCFPWSIFFYVQIYFLEKKKRKNKCQDDYANWHCSKAPKELPLEGSCSLSSAKCPALEGLWAPCWETLPAGFVSWLPGAGSGTAWAWEGRCSRAPGEKWDLQGFCCGIGHDGGPPFPELRCSVPLQFSCPCRPNFFSVFNFRDSFTY